jgi:hypothetical protein
MESVCQNDKISPAELEPIPSQRNILEAGIMMRFRFITS